ncbi:unnamed protein product [Lupinus luteus]|uniref:DCL protein n=1 Tax=Lupinus luteus TaxID=3873 RepID=A0AAV1Y1V2_LUPLU
MAAPLFLRQFLLLRVHVYNYKSFTFRDVAPPHRLWCSAATNQPLNEDENKVGNLVRAKEGSNYPRWDDPDYRKWKDKEKEILSDIEPIILLAKDILHSRSRYLDGEQLSEEDEKVVVERLLAYHPQTQDKIGSGLDSIMVDRHPQFRHSRCLFVVRIDGGWIDFSYQKCLREYIRYKYPTHAERFIREYFKRGSG